MYDSEWLESHKGPEGVRLPDLKRMLEGAKFKSLRPDERCIHRLKLLYGQVRIALGEIEAARQLLIDGFATSRQTFGADDVLTLEFQTSLLEVCIERREVGLALAYLSPELLDTISEVQTIILAARGFYIAGSLDEAETVLGDCLEIFGCDHWTICRMGYALVEVYLRKKDFSSAELVLRKVRDMKIEVKGPEHIDVLLVTLDLARLKIATDKTQEAGQICQALLVQQHKKQNVDINDLINLTKAVLWLSHLWPSKRHSGRIDSENDLEMYLLKSLESGATPNPQLARKWDIGGKVGKISWRC